ncbi:hypothetical protein [Arthrobacter sp. B6]|uniref:hypothetical protein n=1 Tax=Arthrobacter sp. B6 TaxID=1570137 RepID=UPI0008310982|nr:hypothetical protein [Arthrobacter sp. B6]
MKFQLSGLFSKLSIKALPGRTAAGVLGVLAVAVLAFMRMPPSARDVVWAEDGGIFLRDAMARKGLLDIFAPYDGYLHVVPRLAAKTVVRFFAVDDYALAMNFLSCVVVAMVALLVFYCSKAVTSNVYARLGWASITVLVAPAPLETLANFANIHSYFLWLMPWLLLKPATSRLSGVVLFSAALLGALTEIVTALFIPLFALRFRDKAMWPARSGLVIGLVFQAVATMSNPRSHPEGHPLSFPSMVVGWFLNSSSAVVYGNSTQIIANIQNFAAWPAILAAVPFALAAVLVAWKGTTEQRQLAAVFLLSSIAVWSATQVVNFQEYFDYAAFDDERWEKFFLSRYSTVPSMFVLALLPLAALCDRSKTRHLAAAAFSVFLVLQCIYFFPQNTARNEGPEWRTGVSAAREACRSDPALAAAAVDVAPNQWLAGGLRVECALLR